MTLPREDINSEHERHDARLLLRKHWGLEVPMPTFEGSSPTPSSASATETETEEGEGEGEGATKWE